MGVVASVLVAVVRLWIISTVFVMVRCGGCSFDLVVVAVRVSMRVA